MQHFCGIWGDVQRCTVADSYSNGFLPLRKWSTRLGTLSSPLLRSG